MIEAVIFDMDGLLIDSEPLWQRARVEAIGADRLRWTDEDQRVVQGSSTLFWAELIRDRLNNELSVDEVIDRVLGQMAAYYGEAIPLLPGARQAVESLSGRFRLGLASGSPYRLIEAVFRTAGWDGIFEEVLSSDDCPHGKPEPDIYLEIARRMQLPPEHTAVVEDSANGILAGYAAGAKVITVPSEYHGPSAEVLQKAALVLRSLEDLTPDAVARL